MSLAFLVQMGWKSAIIAGAALVILTLLRSRSPADRAAVLQVTVVSLLLLPVISLALPALPVARPALLDWVPPADGAVAASPGPASALSPGHVLALVYLAGVLVLGARVAAGLVTLAVWTRRGAAIAGPEWSAGLARAKAAAGIRRTVRLLASDRAPSPLSWGLIRPVILIDRHSLSRLEDVDPILAHETAHVARRDWLVLILSRLAVTLFWFNPLVWLLERALIQEAEEAADRHAIARIEPLRYAATLLACVRHARPGALAVPANRIVPGRALKRRVDAILDAERRGAPSGSLLTVSAMAACVALSAPVAALELVSAKPAPAPPRTAALAALSRTDAQAAAPASRLARTKASAKAKTADADTEDADPDPEVDVDVDVDIDVDVDADLARAHDVRAREVGSRLARAVTLARSDAERDRAIESEVFGITDADRRDYAALGYGGLAHEELIEMAVHHVSPQFIRDMASAGYPGLTPGQLVKMRIFGVSPDNARQAAAAQTRPSPEELIKMKLTGALMA